MSDAQPQVINLNDQNSIQILMQYIEIAQKSGTFLLQEADILKRCKDVLFSKAQDKEISDIQAKQLFIQAVMKGQATGSYTLDDAAMLNKVCQFVTNSLPVESQSQSQQPQQPQQSLQSEPQQSQPLPQQSQPQIEELDDLSAPVPLRTPRPKNV